ncbi:MAG: protein phosphatase 2C domain-containing protein [Chromatiaceae bacterium]|nr:protein phosphatase 2C domain-containing protein [Chromatiaceae bacterium]
MSAPARPESGPWRWTSAGVTDQGAVRKVNQDAFLDRPDRGLWVVADGMGGHSDGARASRTIVEALAALPRQRLLGRAAQAVAASLRAVNQRLLDDAQRLQSDLIGSTVVALIAVEGHCALLWTGDSRAYRLRSGVLQQLTRDHSQVELLVEQGLLEPEQAESHPAANVLLRAVGAEPVLDVDIRVERLQAGDQFLLCSDGLYREVSAGCIADALQAHEPARSAGELVRLACEHGGKDNVTAVVIRVD